MQRSTVHVGAGLPAGDAATPSVQRYNTEANGVCQKGKVARSVSSSSSGRHQATVNEMIDEVGFGLYQVHLMAICSGAIMGQAGCIAMVSDVVPAIAREFGLGNSSSRAFFAFCLFAGFQLGAALSGPLADSRGRRAPVFVGYVGMLTLCGLVFCIPSAALVYVALVLMGVFAGLCVPTAIIILTEVIPTKFRGMVVAGAAFFFRLGDVWSAVGVYLLMPDIQTGPWRLLVVWALAPAVPCLIFGLCSRAAKQESPHFLASQRRGRELVSSLNVMFEMNDRPDRRIVLDKGIHGEQPEEEPSREAFAKVLSEYPYWFHFLVISQLCFLNEVVSGGMVSLWPQVLANVDNDFGFRELPAFKLLVTAMVAIPGALVAIFMVSRLPRRVTLAVSATVCGGGALMLLRLGPSPWMGLTGLVLVQLLSPSWFVVLLVYPAEIFPTQIRARAFSTTYFLGLCGAEMVQFMTSFLDSTWCLVIYSCAAFASAVLVYLLPETNDSELLNYLSPETIAILTPLHSSEACSDESSEKGYGSFAADDASVAQGGPQETGALPKAGRRGSV
jgi:putative MFS transporter